LTPFFNGVAHTSAAKTTRGLRVHRASAALSSTAGTRESPLNQSKFLVAPPCDHFCVEINNLPADTFKAEGTGVRAALISMQV
jgi:hypothetical protein